MESITDLDPFQVNWNNYSRIYSKSFSQLRKASKYEDVTLVVEDGHTSAHKLVLSTCSPVLATIVDLAPSPGVVYLGDINNKIINLLLDFMYTGLAEVAKEDLDEFLKVADKLKVVGLAENDLESRTNETKGETKEEDNVKEKLHSPNTFRTKRGLTTKKKRRSESFMNNDDHGKDSSKKQKSEYNDSVVNVSRKNSDKSLDDDDIIPLGTSNVKEVGSSNSTDPVKIKEILKEISVGSDKADGDSYDREDIVNCLIAAINSSSTKDSNNDSADDILEVNSKLDDQYDEDIVEVGLMDKVKNSQVPHIDSMDCVETIQNDDINNDVKKAIDDLFNNTVDEIVLDDTPDPAHEGKIILTKSKEDQRKLKKEFEKFVRPKTVGPNTTWLCATCDKQFINEKFALSHADSKHSDHILHKCVQCGMVFATDNMLTKHINTAH